MIQMAGDNIVLNLAITLTSSPFNVTRNLLNYKHLSPPNYHIHITRVKYYPGIIEKYRLSNNSVLVVFKLSSALAIISCLLWIRIFPESF